MLSKHRPKHPELVRLQGCRTRPELAGIRGPASHSLGGLPVPARPGSAARPTAVAATSSAKSKADRRARRRSQTKFGPGVQRATHAN